MPIRQVRSSWTIPTADLGLAMAASLGNGECVMVSRLKLYRAEDEIDVDVPPAPEADIRVRLGDLLPLVAFAQKLQFIWLKDFLDDEVKVTDDLYRVLQSFRALRPVA